MASAPLFCIIKCRDSTQPTVKSSLHCERGTIVENLFPSQKIFGRFSSSSSFTSRKRWLSLYNHTKLFSKARLKKGDDDFIVGNRSMLSQSFTERHFVMNGHLKSSSSGISPIDRPILEPYSSATRCNDSSATGCNERQLKSLDSYFVKLHDKMNEEHISSMPTSDFGIMSDSREYQTVPTSSLGQKIVSTEEVDLLKAKTGLGSLENYFDKLGGGIQTGETTPQTSTKDDSESSLTRLNVTSETASTLKTHDNHMPLERMDNETVPVTFGEKNFQDSLPYDEASDFYLINLLASVDIGVFLFEIATPIRSSDVEQLSLPLLYGAKINKLILDGEWWRIVTPMFLHSGFLHIALGCWVLLTFGPQVCRGYGPFAFFFIYILGGICANLTSFLHTPELTVCGTGPAFAIIGAWLIYQVQNKEAIAKEISENLFWKAVAATALTFVICNFEQADEWSHLGAVFSGLVYGFLTCPTTLVGKAPSDNSQKEGIALLKQQADPCKSAAIFTLSIFVLCFLVFLFEPGFDALELDDFL